MGIVFLHQVDQQGDQQEHCAGLTARHHAPNGYQQVQNITDPANRFEALGLLGIYRVDIDHKRSMVHIIHGDTFQSFSCASRKLAWRAAFSSNPLIPTRRSSSAMTAWGDKP